MHSHSPASGPTGVATSSILQRSGTDRDIRHVYIKPRSPQLNGKVERSHRSDKEEFYQLLTYTDDVDLNKKLEEWERFYNYDRPHGAFKGKTPYETLRNMLT